MEKPEIRLSEAAEQEHPFEPIWSRESRILILGSFPSVRSREEGFYYGHPRNRFWAMLARIYGEETPESVEQKTELILRHRLALWDALHSCRVTGSADASIRDAVPNDIPRLIVGTQITRVLANGQTAAKACQKAGFPYPLTVLPSTSPANAAWSLERLCEVWGRELKKEE